MPTGTRTRVARTPAPRRRPTARRAVQPRVPRCPRTPAQPPTPSNRPIRQIHRAGWVGQNNSSPGTVCPNVGVQVGQFPFGAPVLPCGTELPDRLYPVLVLGA